MSTAESEGSDHFDNPLPGGGDFWNLAAQSQPYTLFNPAGFDELIRASDRVVVARAVKVSRYEGPDELSVTVTIQDELGTDYPIRFLLPPLVVEKSGFDELTRLLPTEPAVWILSEATGNTVPGYFECTQYYFCAYVQEDSQVVPAMPDVWLPGVDKARTLEDLISLSKK